MYALFFVLNIFLAPILVTAAEAPSAQPASPCPVHSKATRDQAQNQADAGCLLLSYGQLYEAQTEWVAALKLDPKNNTARQCLDALSSKLIERDLFGLHHLLDFCTIVGPGAAARSHGNQR